MMYVVTEFGLVNLKGKSVPERARAMIPVAHPDYRDDLSREAARRDSCRERSPEPSTDEGSIELVENHRPLDHQRRHL